MSDQETATAPEAAAPAPVAATAPEAPKPEATPATPAAPSRTEPDWEIAYKGLQTKLNRVHARADNLASQNALLAAKIDSLTAGQDDLLKQSLGEEQFKERVVQRQFAQERQEALAAAKTAQEFIPAAIDVMASTMRAAGVTEQDIAQVFLAARDTGTVAEWNEITKAGTSVAIARARERVEQQARAKSQQEIQAEAQALAERTVRAKGIDKVDLGRGQSRTPERSFIERVRSADRSTPEGEAAFQSLLKEAKRGTLKT